MMQRIVYTKLNYSLLSQCGINLLPISEILLIQVVYPILIPFFFFFFFCLIFYLFIFIFFQYLLRMLVHLQNHLATSLWLWFNPLITMNDNYRLNKTFMEYNLVFKGLKHITRLLSSEQSRPLTKFFAHALQTC